MLWLPRAKITILDFDFYGKYQTTEGLLLKANISNVTKFDRKEVMIHAPLHYCTVMFLSSVGQ